jgi:hypothetical protein
LPIHIFEAPIVNHPDFGSMGPRVRIAADRHTRKVYVCAPARAPGARLRGNFPTGNMWPSATAAAWPQLAAGN